MRRGASAALPWVALLAVTVFALVQVRARRRAEEQGAPPTPVVASPIAPVAGDPPADPEGDLRRARSEWEAEKRDLETALEEARALRNRAEAVRAAAESRAAALTVDLEVAQRELARARDRTASLEQELANLEESQGRARDPLIGLLEEARAATDAATFAALKPRAARLTEEEVGRLRALLRADATLAPVVARLLPALPLTEPAGGIALDLLLAADAESDAAARVEATGQRLMAPDPLARVLKEAGPRVLREMLARAGAATFTDEERARLGAVLRDRLGEDSPALEAQAARGLGLLRAPGAAARLAALLGSPVEEVRESAAYALSRAPDLASARAPAVEALPRLLGDPSLRLRTAAVLLAEALLGETLAFDPAAPESARREALARILPRLKP